MEESKTRKTDYPRVNLAIPPESYEFVKVMARATGQTITEFINYVLEAYQKEHPEFMEQAKGFIDLVNKKIWSEKSAAADHNAEKTTDQ